jgi:hypothetical protein
LTARQRLLYDAVVASATHVQERLLMLSVHAYRVGASQADSQTVRELLVAGHVRECNG